MRVGVPYGKSQIKFDIDDKRVMEIIAPSEIAPSSAPSLEVERALKHPIGGRRIEELSSRGKTIAIAVDDMTRQTPTHILLPPIVGLLEKGGARKEDIKVIVALGTHRRMTDQEMKEKYSAEIIEKYEVINHVFDDERELKYMGRTSCNIPVWINKDYIKADIRIAIGNIVPHFNAGWAGGGKTLLPGLAGEETVGRMHAYSAITTPNGLGMEENPTRRLIEAFATKVGIHFLINTTITRHREIVKVFAGHLVKAHRKGIVSAKKIYGVETSGPADITICSSHPADMDFWQGQKGLFPADLATKIGGGILELTPCPEGVSVMHPKWVDYLQYNTKELRNMITDGGVEDLVAWGLAMNVAYVRERHPLCILSDGLRDRDAQKMGLQKFRGIDEALKHLSSICGSDSRVNVLTHGGETYPILKQI